MLIWFFYGIGRIVVNFFSTYFVEYQFPVVTTSKVMSQPNIMATEVMRVASKKVVNGGKDSHYENTHKL